MAVLFDWNNWWAIDAAIGPIRQKEYVATVRKHYRALWRRNVPVDVVFSDSDLSGYDLVVAPMLHMVKAGLPEQLAALVARGGAFVTTYFSGVVDETDLAFEGYPGPLRQLLGIWVEEIDALYEGQTNQIVMADGSGSYSCGRLCDIIHSEGAQVLATYGQDFYAGTPVLTANAHGSGRAYYIASDPEERFLDGFYGGILAEKGIAPPFDAPSGVELALRETDEQRLLFVLNHSAEAQTVALPAGQRYAELLGGGEVAEFAGAIGLRRAHPGPAAGRLIREDTRRGAISQPTGALVRATHGSPSTVLTLIRRLFYGRPRHRAALHASLLPPNASHDAARCGRPCVAPTSLCCDATLLFLFLFSVLCSLFWLSSGHRPRSWRSTSSPPPILASTL